MNYIVEILESGEYKYTFENGGNFWTTFSLTPNQLKELMLIMNNGE